LAELAGADVAERYAFELRNIYQRLTMFPAIGPSRAELGQHARIAILHPYIVVYDHVLGSETVTIVRVLDGRRNITRRSVRE